MLAFQEDVDMPSAVRLIARESEERRRRREARRRTWRLNAAFPARESDLRYFPSRRSFGGARSPRAW